MECDHGITGWTVPILQGGWLPCPAFPSGGSESSCRRSAFHISVPNFGCSHRLAMAFGFCGVFLTYSSVVISCPVQPAPPNSRPLLSPQRETPCLLPVSAHSGLLPEPLPPPATPAHGGHWLLSLWARLSCALHITCAFHFMQHVTIRAWLPSLSEMHPRCSR